ncbi:hypothetical protein [Saccharothrix sp. ALI-22-I]|uniref:hypothetical protein n=1 Tax=Saccharothrix sp. ALI-22-I TaxID=1933778 RepID=UPI00117A04AF|nr:hypothetical protein [Saccharothrix sp. ALI-22-I]
MTTAVAIRAVAGVFVALVLSACGSSAEPTAADLFREYLDAPNVRWDPFQGANAADRRADMASTGSVSQIQDQLFAADRCGDDGDDGDDLAVTESPCGSGMAVAEAVKGFTGSTGTVHRRSILVKRGGGFEWMIVYVARKSDGSSALVDTKGRLYPGGLDDFRRNNRLLDADDWVLAPRNITATTGHVELVVVSGHTRMPWELWVVGGVGLLVVAVGGRWLIRRRRVGSD